MPPSANLAWTSIQRLGRLLSGMVMPNIGAFIAWGVLTAGFGPAGWMPNDSLARLLEPMVAYLLPLLIGYTGGKCVHGMRGGVIGAVTTVGVIAGTGVPMLLGAMFAGPSAAWLLRSLDGRLEGRLRPGFEMLANNLSLGVLGAACALVALWGVGPLMNALSTAVTKGLSVIVAHELLPLTHVLIEPCKVLFLNNAINHGILNPIATAESQSSGKSILFMLESNPGPGLGLLLAYWLLGKRDERRFALGASAIQFFGGIHEVYFPYVLMMPRLLLALIAGGACGTFVAVLLDAGLVASPSPGSIVTCLALAPGGFLLPILAAIGVSALVSFAVAVVLLRFVPACRPDAFAPETGTAGAGALGGVRKIVFACDGGMGSSVLGACLLRNRFRKAGISVSVGNSAIDDLPPDADLVLTHESLVARARKKLPAAEHLPVKNFLESPVYDQLVARFHRVP